MERRGDSDEHTGPTDEPRDAETAGLKADSVQGWEVDQPTDPELSPDDGYHPDEGGGPKYEEPDPVDEPLLAREEGLSSDKAEELEAESGPS